MDILDSIDDLIDDENENEDDYELEEDESSDDLDEILSVSNELDEILETEGLAEIVSNEEYEVIMSEHEAKEITNSIRSTGAAMSALIIQAHTGKAYRALGYTTWAEYVKEELNYSPQRSYQLLDLAKTTKMFEEVTPEGTNIKLTEAQVRDIKQGLPKITEQIEEETYGMDADEAGDAVTRIVEEAREQQKADEAAIAAREKSVQEAESEGYNKGLEAAADAFLEADTMNKMTDNADDEFVEIEVSGDGSFSPEQTMNLHNFANVLSGVASLPTPDDIVDLVPDTNFDDLYDKVIESASYMNRLATLMEVRRDER